MSEQPDHILLAYMKRFDAKLDRLIDDVQDVKHRLTSMERQMADVRGDLANMAGRLDRIETRLDRVERRLELSGATSEV